MEESVHTFQIVSEEEQCNGGPQKKCPLEENKTPARMSYKWQGMDQSTKIRKVVEGHPTAVGMEARVE